MSAPTRREFVAQVGIGALQLSAVSLGLPTLVQAMGAMPRAAREPWGEIVQVGPGSWAMLSAPLADRTTLCNGGFIAGRERVLMVEAFAGDVGARWVRERARALAGREVTDVVLTHYHADHTGGIRGAVEQGATLHCTAATRESVRTRNQNAPQEELAAARELPATAPLTLDLGGRQVRLLPLDGHTSSDVAVVVDDDGICLCGDLVWFGMFPNFVDAVPSRLSASVRTLRALEVQRFVTGHGVVTDRAGLAAYAALLDDVEAAARRAFERGDTPEAAGAAYALPPAMREWTLFSPRYFERAIGAWMRELRGA